jgi:hypothetical protein
MKHRHLILAALLLATPARAADALERPIALYEAGKFDAAALAAEAVQSAAGQAFAARALLAYATTAVKAAERRAYYEQALARADAAVKADGTLIDARLQKVSALGAITRLSDDLSAANRAMSSEIKEQIDAGLAQDPQSPAMQAALGSWNLDVVHRAGMSAFIVGASTAHGLAAFEQALATGPAKIPICFEYALALAALDAGKYQDKIDALAADALGVSAHDAYERILQERLKLLRAALVAHDGRALNAVIRGLRGAADLPETRSP